ncbi:MAG: hypothetical protein J1E31_07540 [Helicobacter sp.]|nr:hypothetical protein [Helicobacter sp.]
MKKIFVTLFLIAVLANLSFADFKEEREELIESNAEGCIEEGANRNFCFCMAKEFVNSLSDKEVSLLLSEDAQTIQRLQMKAIHLFTDENKIKYCLGK